MTTRLYIGNLPFTATSQDILDFFGPSARNVKLCTDRETGRPRGFGFIDYDGDLNEVLSSFDGADFGGRSLRVREADAKPQRRDERSSR
jgi:RNA recognition motif-containing protein